MEFYAVRLTAADWSWASRLRPLQVASATTRTRSSDHAGCRFVVIPLLRSQTNIIQDLSAELATVDQPEQAVDGHAVASEHFEEGQDWAEDAEVGQEGDDDHSSPAAEGEDDGGLEHETTGALVIGGDDGHAVADDSAWVEDGTEVVQTNTAAPVNGTQPEEFESHDEPAEGAEVEASVDEDSTEQYEDEEWAADGEAEGVYADGEAEVVYAEGETAELQVLGEVELEGDDESAEYDVGEYAEGQHDLESAAGACVVAGVVLFR